MIEGRIEETKRRIAKALHDINHAANALLKQNAKLEKECLDLHNIQNHMESSIASLEAENAVISEKLETISKIDNKSKTLQTTLAVEAQYKQQQSNGDALNTESELCTVPETLVDRSTSEYIDVSINQLKRLLKQKINK